MPLRYHVTPDAYYLADSPAMVLRDGSGEWLERFLLPDLLRGTAVIAPGAPPYRGEVRPLTNESPARTFRMFGTNSRFKLRLYYDYLPMGATGARQFVIANTSGTIVRTRSYPDGYDSGHTELTEEQRDNPRWSFTYYRTVSGWDDEKKQWSHGPWTFEGALPLTFRERFHALQKGDDFFFLTASGKLYVSRPATVPHAARAVLRAYVADDRPILGMVVDVLTQRTFLFLGPDTRPAFFELSDRPTLTRYDPKSVPMPDGDEPLRSQMHKARVLAALGKIKDK